MARGGIVWTRPPSILAKAIEDYGEKAKVAIKAVADYMANEIEGYAKQNAPWQDHTGNARNALHGTTEVSEKIVAIYLAQGMDYGKWLELCNSGKYAIVMKALEANYSELMDMLKRTFAA